MAAVHFVGHDHLGLRVPENIPELSSPEGRVDRIVDRTRFECAERGHEIFDRVAERECDAITLRNTERAKGVRGPIRQAVELAIRDPPAGMKNERVVTARGDVAGENVKNQHRRAPGTDLFSPRDDTGRPKMLEAKMNLSPSRQAGDGAAE